MGTPQRKHFRNLVSLGVPLGLLAVGAGAQSCRPGSVELDVSIQCACVKNPNSEPCELYKRNKSMYDGKGIQMWQPSDGAPKTDPAPYRASQPSVPQQRTPVSATLLPADTPFWQMLPAGTRIAVGMRPQWLTASPLLAQLLSLGGQMAGQNMDSVRRELAGVDMVIMASTRSGATPLILARAADVVRATKAERDPYRYVDPDTILVGDWNETDAAMRRLFSEGPVSGEAKMAGRVAAWSDVWLIIDPRVTASMAAQLPGVTKMTVGMAMRDGLTMEAWLDTPSALAAKNLAARLQKNPQGAPLFGQMSGATSSVEQRDNSVRLYARVSGSQLTGSVAPEGTPVRLPALDVVTRDKIAEVQEGMDRAAVESLVGKPHSVMSIQGADEPIETLIYNLNDKGTARVRVVNGKVASVQLFD
jgi:hypothetical protein